MTEPRDEISTWLDAPVEPLAPPSGTYERIRRRARRRRRHQAIGAAATVAAVVVAVVAAPRLAGTLFPAGRGAPAAAGGAASATATSSPHPSNVLPSPPGATGNGPKVPNGFVPVSVTFVGLDTGWALGTLPPPCPASGCLALARTDDKGATWRSVPALPTGLTYAGGSGPSGGGGSPPGGAVPPRAGTVGSGGVSQVRFLNREDGWLFGPQLWWTNDGGQSWQQASTGGHQVISLEAVGRPGRAYAVFASCAAGGLATGPGQPVGCTSYQLFSAVAGTAAWQPVPGATSGAGAAAVVLTAHTGYLLAASGPTLTLSSGPAGANGAWQSLTTPCPPSPGPSSAAAPHGAVLAGAPGADLFAVCGADQATASQGAKEIVASGDGGQTWHRRAVAPIPGSVWSAAVTPNGGVLVVAASSGLYISADNGASWRLALTGPPGGFGYVGMTDVLQGFAVSAQPGRDGMLMTTDGGITWQPPRISGPG